MRPVATSALTLVALVACSRAQEPAPPVAAPVPEPALAPAAPIAPVAPAAAPAAEPAAAPHLALTGEHYQLNVDLTSAGAVPGPGTIALALHATNGFHVNELFPTTLELHPTDATMPASVRVREAGHVSREEATVSVPVVLSAAAASVHATLRFAVCSDENCVPQTRTFTLALR